MSDVFISYKRRLRPRVEAIAEQLERLGLTVWFDAELEPGTTFSAEISYEVRTARCVLVCWTNDAFPHGGDEHGWVVGEATIGRSRKVLVAVTLEPTDLDPPWNTVHCEDLSEWTPGARGRRRDSWGRIVEAIGRHVDRPGLPELDAALTAGTIRALAGWLEAFPDDPLVPDVQSQVERRRRKRKTKAAVASSSHQGEDTDAVTDRSVDLSLAVERGLMDVTTEIKADELEWLERDLALSEDLSFEREKLEEAVAAALNTSIEKAEPITAEPIPSMGPPDGPVTALVEGKYAPWSKMLFACTISVAASAGLGILVSLYGWTNTNLGGAIVAVICPAVFGFLISAYGGHDAPRINVVLASITAPIVAFGAGLNAMIAQFFMPANFALAGVGSFAGALVYLLILSGLGIYRHLPDWYFAAGAAFVTVAVVSIALPFSLDVRDMTDAPWIMLIWEAAFGVALILAPRRARGPPD